MKVTELKQKKYKKLLEELKDFCEYGECLQEETAKDYLKFLIDALCLIRDRYGDKAVENTENRSKVNSIRFQKEREDLKDKADTDYFEGQTLAGFEKDFERMFSQLKTQYTLDGKRKISTKWIEWIQDTFNNYVARFEKRSPEISTDFRNQAGWKNKKGTSNTGKYLPSAAKH